MGYPRDNLAPDEVVLLHRHPHWKTVLAPFVLFLVSTAIAGVLAGLAASASISSGVRFWLLIVIGIGWALIFTWYFLRPLMRWKTTHFVLTDRRVIYRTGIASRSGIDIPVRRINSVEFHHGLLDRMLRTGTLLIESAADDPLSFHSIPQVEKVHAMLYREVLDAHPDDDRYPVAESDDRR